VPDDHPSRADDHADRPADGLRAESVTPAGKFIDR
jgi:hypothetical protein